MITFRLATRDDVPAVVALLRDDSLGATREGASTDTYFAAFDAMQAEVANHLVVGEIDGDIVATYQITFISGLSLRASRRAQIESVRVASQCRGQGYGQAMFADVEHRARAAGCTLIQLTMNTSRIRSHQFYEQLGFSPSHTGFKRILS